MIQPNNVPVYAPPPEPQQPPTKTDPTARCRPGERHNQQCLLMTPPPRPLYRPLRHRHRRGRYLFRQAWQPHTRRPPGGSRQRSTTPSATGTHAAATSVNAQPPGPPPPHWGGMVTKKPRKPDRHLPHPESRSSGGVGRQAVRRMSSRANCALWPVILRCRPRTSSDRHADSDPSPHKGGGEAAPGGTWPSRDNAGSA